MGDLGVTGDSVMVDGDLGGVFSLVITRNFWLKWRWI